MLQQLHETKEGLTGAEAQRVARWLESAEARKRSDGDALAGSIQESDDPYPALGNRIVIFFTIL